MKIIKDGVVLDEPFLDVGADLHPGRTGVASIAFAPDYATSGLVYVLYAAPAAGGADGVDVVLDEFSVGSDPDRVDMASRRNVLRLSFAGTTDHDADHIAFGPDGLLYMTVGEGANDANSSQDTAKPRGKLFRIDPRQDGTSPYRIPAHNPFADGVGGMPEVLAYGLRNPWRFSFDDEEEVVLVADVGHATNEELSIIRLDTAAAPNLGWPCWEGTMSHNTCTAPGHHPPAFEYTHSGGACSIIGGYIADHPGLPSLDGRYVYGDFCTGDIRSLDVRTVPVFDDQPTGLSVPDFGLASFGQDGCGHLYVASQSNLPTGNVWRIDEEPFEPCPEPPPPPPPPPPPAGETNDPGPPPDAPLADPQPIPVPPFFQQRAPRDQQGPLLALDRGQARSGRLAGSAFDPSGVRTVRVALRAPRARQRTCRWWRRSLRRLQRRGSTCRKPKWMRAELAPRAGGIGWSVALGETLPEGRYEVLMKAADGAGNVSSTVDGRALAAFAVR